MFRSAHLWILISVLITVHCVERRIKDKNYWTRQSRAELSRVLGYDVIDNVAKNVIILIGDGLGTSTYTATRIYKGELDGNKMDDDSNLHSDAFQNVAFARTMCSDRMVGSSGCIAAAILNGVKCRDSVINVDDRVAFKDCKAHVTSPDTNVEKLISIASKSGRSTGVVTTARITHATPAAAYASSVSRYWERDTLVPAECKALNYKDIAKQLVEDNHYINVLFGGGRRELLPENVADPASGTGARKDGRNLVNEWKEKQRKKNKSFKYVTDLNGFNNIPLQTDYVMGLFADSALKYEEKRKVSNDEPSLSQMTAKAIRLLQKNKKGFFLIVESALIDYAHHDSLARLALSESVEFDKVLKTALDLTDERETLILFTADHGHVFNIGGYPKVELPILGVSHQMSKTDEMPYTILSYGNGPGFNHSWPLGRQNLTGVDTTGQDYVQISAVPDEYESHSGEDVGLYAHGAMSHLVRGVHHQPYISQVMRYAACLKPYDVTRRCTHHTNDVTKVTASSSFTGFILLVSVKFFFFWIEH